MYFDKARYDELCDQIGSRVEQLSSSHREHQSDSSAPRLTHGWTTNNIPPSPLRCAGFRIEFETAATASLEPYRLFSPRCQICLLDLPANDSRLQRRSSLFFELPLKFGLLYELSLSLGASATIRTVVDSVVEFAPDIRLLDAVWRYLKSHDSPQDTIALATSTEREIWYHLLCSPAGPALISLVAYYTAAGRVRRATSWIKQHYAEKLAIEDLAYQVGVSTSSLYSNFRRSIGVTPVGFQRLLRLSRACELITGHPQVSAVALSVGYESTRQFARDYVKTYGVSPYRQEN
ncbi:helix-turn-helix domain-containing protein [Paraburkholderia caribensis]|uniref:helix-turn-helix domain-containing protein n=1 Tax=Paraburkholderia caribensis TaxID=75105 RepID=UPI001CAD6D6D|nr:helix-turn-helix domain-containing protein [Paraburkholderia caribensis]CAG9243743.1 hypothetical protein PCAR4_140026 [Paraburkholderia caribensis]